MRFFILALLLLEREGSPVAAEAQIVQAVDEYLRKRYCAVVAGALLGMIVQLAQPPTNTEHSENMVTDTEFPASHSEQAPTQSEQYDESVHISRIQLILAEKRTSLAVMRTGIVVFTLPMSVMTVLIATSRYYDFLEAYHLLIPLLVLCAGLVVFAVYLVHRSIVRIRKQDVLIHKIKEQDHRIADFLGDGV